ncbi:hypothetical protein ACI2KR_06650 [Pseudomonas luteola]
MDNETDNGGAPQLTLAEHIKRFGTSAKGKTGSFETLAKQLTDIKSGLSWKEAWMLYLQMLGHKNRLPRGFNGQP